MPLWVMGGVVQLLWEASLCAGFETHLRCRVAVDRAACEVEQGTPQGSELGPLLAVCGCTGSGYDASPVQKLLPSA